jgi:Predicted membrane protein
MAQAEEGSPPKESIELDAKYPIRPGPADTKFEFEVNLLYIGGDEPCDFDLSVTGPVGWAAIIQQSTYEEKQIASVRLNPFKYTSESVVVVAMSPFWLYPEPGDYTIKFEAVEAKTGKPKNSIDLTARITARYGIFAESNLEGGRLNIKAKAGDESYLPITVTNTGTAALDKITFSSTKPEGWSTTFKPEKIESLSPGDKQEVEVTVKPASKTIAGDYMIALSFDSDPKPSTAPSKLNIRVTVGTSTKWGWIGVGIVIAVIAGLAVTFTRLGRR